MPNLETDTGLRCPKCIDGSTEERIHVTTLVAMRANSLGMGAVVPQNGLRFLESDLCECKQCHYTATVADFRLKSVTQMLLDVVEEVKRVIGSKPKHTDEDRHFWDISNAAIADAKERGLNR